MKRILTGIVALTGVAVLALGVVLAEAHWEMRGIEAPLPGAHEIAEKLAVREGPTRIAYLNTSEQKSGSSKMGHPSFVIEWANGQIFLVDTGMESEAALQFGKMLEWAFDAEPAEAFGPPGPRLGATARNVRGVAFTHLHNDHTNGTSSVCEAAGHEIGLFQTADQAERGNFSIAMGRQDLERATCLRPMRANGVELQEVPGSPGLLAFPAAGHTPGSTIYLARVGDRIWILAGDVTNSFENLLENQPKELVYSTFIVPENRRRLEALRVWLRGLHRDPRFFVVVSHDLDALEASGMPRWGE